ncbi:Uncharacterised protein [Serratia plymuthica]|nr:Uncharacterised protein [Serratia plymuthica]
MSGGGSIPYHLRQNKAIERNLYVELLRRLNNYINISEYVYIGFGGPFLEDFKQLHNALKVNKMISLEVDKNVHLRQKFNKPLSCIDLGDEPLPSGEFINKYNFDEKTLIWLDYAIPSELNTQLNELSALITKLKHKDVFKITLNATPETLGRDPLERDPKPFRLKNIIDILTDEYCPINPTESDVTFKKYPEFLFKAIHRAINSGLRGRRDIRIQPLTTFVYKDGQQMITFTGIALENRDEEQQRFIQETRIENWSFYNGTWDSPKNINVPVMSLKERIEVEALLPEASARDISEKLGYYIGKNSSEADINLCNFIEYYKVIPWYSKVLL